MEDYTTWTAGDLIKHYDDLAESLGIKPGIKFKFEAVTAELDRRCNEVFEWEDGQLHIEPDNPFVSVHQSLWTDSNFDPCHEIKSYPISNPAEFSALLSYFLTKPRT